MAVSMIIAITQNIQREKGDIHHIRRLSPFLFVVQSVLFDNFGYGFSHLGRTFG